MTRSTPRPRFTLRVGITDAMTEARQPLDARHARAEARVEVARLEWPSILGREEYAAARAVVLRHKLEHAERKVQACAAKLDEPRGQARLDLWRARRVIAQHRYDGVLKDLDNYRRDVIKFQTVYADLFTQGIL